MVYFFLFTRVIWAVNLIVYVFVPRDWALRHVTGESGEERESGDKTGGTGNLDYKTQN